MVQHDVLLKTVNLTKRFGNLIANDQINFEVLKGEVHCLLGENGAGKSTFANCLYGFLQPDDGQIIYKGQAVDLASPHHAIELGIGMVHQHFELVEPHTVVENIILGAEPKGMLLNLKKAERRIVELCELYGVDLDPNARIWQLSVGQQQWVEILKALYVGVDLLILDEPTACLTPQEAERLFSVLRQMIDEGLSIIFITHKLKEVMAISNRVTVLRRGKHVETVNTADMTRQSLARLMVGRDVVFRVEKQPMPPGDPVLEIKNLYTHTDQCVCMLEGIDLTLYQHEILGIAGVAGNGQKELFEALVGVQKPDTGQILVHGEDVTGKSPMHIREQGVGHIPNDRIKEGLILDFPIAENLIIGHHWNAPYRNGLVLDTRQINQLADDMVEQFEIATPTARQRTRHLSGGNLQKVILARELEHTPQVLLANQPCRGLDVGAIEYVHRQLLQKRSEGMGILLISEDLDEIFNLSDRIAVIYRGRILGVFPVEEARLEQIGLLMAGVTEEAG